MNRRNLLIALLVIGILASVYVAFERVRVESQNRAVEIVLDYDEITDLAAATGRTPMDIMREFKKAGVTSVAITERTVKEAVDAGDIHLNIEPGGILVDGSDIHHLGLLLPKSSYSAFDVDSRVGGFVRYVIKSMPPSYLNQLPVGLPSGSVDSVISAGLEPVARLTNYNGATPEAIDNILADTHRQGVNKIIFSGDQVLGFKGAVEDTADSLVKHDLYFGRVEFSKQKGELNLAEHARANTIVVHSITQAEMPTLDKPSIVERFSRGVRERGVRMAYVRMYDTSGKDIVADNVDYVRSIVKSIERAGYEMKSAHPMREVSAPRIARVLVAIGVAAGAMLLLLSIVNLSTAAGLIWSIGLIVACAGLVAIGDTGQKASRASLGNCFPYAYHHHRLPSTQQVHCNIIIVDTYARGRHRCYRRPINRRTAESALIHATHRPVHGR